MRKTSVYGKRLRYRRAVPCEPGLPMPGCSAAKPTTRRNSWAKERLGAAPPFSRYHRVASSASASASGLNETRIGQRAFSMMASRRANTSSAGIQTVLPASISATRRAISSSQAWAMASGVSSDSPSRLTIKRWISSPRSWGERLKAWFSISFNMAVITRSRKDFAIEIVALAT